MSIIKKIQEVLTPKPKVDIAYVLFRGIRISPVGLKLIKDFEGLSLFSYLCPAGKYTIGYGHTKDVQPGTVITLADAEQLLLEDTLFAIKAVAENVWPNTKLEQHQIDALISLVYNIGAGNFKSSTLLRRLNQGDVKAAEKEFHRWIYVKGKPSNGLIRRRKAEASLFSGKSYI